MALISLTTVSDELAGAGPCAEVSNGTNYQLRKLAPAFRYPNMKSQEPEVSVVRLDACGSLVTVNGRKYIVERDEDGKTGFTAWTGKTWKQDASTRTAAIAACVFHALSNPVRPRPAQVIRYSVEVQHAA